METKDITDKHLSLLGAYGGEATEVAEITDIHRLSTTDFIFNDMPWKLEQVTFSKPQLHVNIQSAHTRSKHYTYTNNGITKTRTHDTNGQQKNT